MKFRDKLPVYFLIHSNNSLELQFVCVNLAKMFLFKMFDSMKMIFESFEKRNKLFLF